MSYSPSRVSAKANFWGERLKLVCSKDVCCRYGMCEVCEADMCECYLADDLITVCECVVCGRFACKRCCERLLGYGGEKFAVEYNTDLQTMKCRVHLLPHSTTTIEK